MFFSVLNCVLNLMEGKILINVINILMFFVNIKFKEKIIINIYNINRFNLFVLN